MQDRTFAYDLQPVANIGNAFCICHPHLQVSAELKGDAFWRPYARPPTHMEGQADVAWLEEVCMHKPADAWTVRLALGSSGCA